MRSARREFQSCGYNFYVIFKDRVSLGFPRFRVLGRFGYCLSNEENMLFNVENNVMRRKR